MEPWGSLRDDYRAGLVWAMVGNAAPFRRKGAKTFSPTDPFPHLKPGKAKKQSPGNMLAIAMAMTKAMGGKIVTATR